MCTGDPPRRGILALCCFCMATSNFLMMGPALCLSTMAGDLGMAQEAQKGVFLSASFWGLGAMSLVSGWLADRWGFRLLLGVSALLQMAGLLLISMAAGQEQAIGGGLLGGVGRGMVSAPLTALLCSLYPDERTWVSNLFHGFYYVGVVLTVLLVLALLQLGWGWRPMFQLYAVLVLSYGLAALVLPLPGPVPRTAEAGRTSVRHLVRQPAFAVLLAATFCIGIAEIGPSNWLPYFIEQATGASREVAAIGLLLFAATMAAGRLSVLVLVRRWGVQRFFVAAGLLCVCSLLLAALPVGTGFSVFWLAVLGLGLAGIYPTMLGYTGDRFPRAGPPMFALLNGANILGGVIGPVSVGLAADAAGLRPAMGLLAFAPLIFVVSLLLAPRPRSARMR